MFNSAHTETQQAQLLEAFVSQVQDPRVRLALVCCKEQITEPPLNLRQALEALACVRASGKPPCARTAQRWVKEGGMPCSREKPSNRRIYFLSKILAWYQEAFSPISIAEEAFLSARQALLKGPRVPKGNGPSRPLRPTG